MTTISIVTGASRGMGEAVALQLAQRGHVVLGISRGSSPALAAQPGVTQWAHDLAEPGPLASRLSLWLGGFKAVSELNLINNAAVMTQPGPARLVGSADAARALRIGLEAVVVLTQATLEAAAGWHCTKRVLNVSSGNGRRAIAGAAVYSAIKAGLDHYSRVLALDEASTATYTGAKVVSLAPGVIDTDMQVQLRSADPARFAAQPMFAQYHADGHLWSPHAAAQRLLAYLDRPDFGDNPVADVRD